MATFFPSRPTRIGNAWVNVANAEIGCFVFGPFDPGEVVEALNITVSSLGATAVTDFATLDIRVGSHMPIDSTEAGRMRGLFADSSALAGAQPLIGPTASGSGVHPVRVELNHEATEAERFIFVGLTVSSARAFNFTCFLEMSD